MKKTLLTTNRTNRTKGRRKDFKQKVRVFRVVRGKILFLSFIFLLSSFIFAQTGTSLETEIQNIERSIARQGVPAAERHAGLVRLATLRQLSGDIEGAARNWLEAARAVPGRVDDDALLNCAYCLAAMGEWDRARTALEPLISKSARANFLNTSINAITRNDTSALAALADNPAYASFKSEIYFLLWKLSSMTSGPASSQAQRWRQRLTAEFPQSPEARLASGGSQNTEQTIALRQSPFWLFIGGLDSLQVLPSITEGRPAQVAGNREQAAGQVQTPSPPTPTTQALSAPVSYARLQTGIFSQQANAQTQAQRLRQQGFTPAVEERTIGENKMWAVTVPVEQEQALKNAGIEYFPLR